MSPRPKTKKTVSFIDKENEVKTKGVANDCIPIVKSSISVIPFHNLIIVYGMFKMGLTHNVEGIMIKGFLTSLPLTTVYNYILFSQLSRKNRQDVNLPLLLLSSIIITVLISIPLHLILVLMGAPIYKYSTKTFYLSLHLSQLVFNPLIILYTLDLNQFKHLFQQQHLYKLIFTNPILASVVLALAGCWLGVIPIPLDWDRPWQQWPITLLVGGYIGSVVGTFISIIVKYMK